MVSIAILVAALTILSIISFIAAAIFWITANVSRPRTTEHFTFKSPEVVLFNFSATYSLLALDFRYTEPSLRVLQLHSAVFTNGCASTLFLVFRILHRAEKKLTTHLWEIQVKLVGSSFLGFVDLKQSACYHYYQLCLFISWLALQPPVILAVSFLNLHVQTKDALFQCFYFNMSRRRVLDIHNRRLSCLNNELHDRGECQITFSTIVTGLKEFFSCMKAYSFCFLITFPSHQTKRNNNPLSKEIFLPKSPFFSSVHL